MSAGKRFSGKVVMSYGGLYLTAAEGGIYPHASSIGPDEIFLLYMADGGGGLLNGPIQSMGSQKWLAYVSNNQGFDTQTATFYGANADYANALPFVWSVHEPPAIGWVIQNGQMQPIGLYVGGGTPLFASFTPNSQDPPHVVHSLVTPGLDSVRASGGVERGDFSYVDLTDEDLGRLNLHQGNFSHATLRNTSFAASSLNQTVWQHAVFANTTLAGCSLQTADFSNCDLTGQDFSGCDLTGATFAGSKLVNASFRNAAMTGCTFDHADLTGADFTGATLPRSSFVGADLSNVVCGNNTDLYHGNFTSAKLRHGHFRAVRMGAGNYTGADLTGADFTATDLSHSYFVGAIFQATNFSDSELNSSNFTACDLSSVICSPGTRTESSQAQPMIFRRAIVPFDLIQERVWTGSDLVDATVLDMPKDVSTQARPLQAAYALMTGLNQSGSHKHPMSHMNWQYADLDNAVLSGLDFSGSDFTGSSLQQAICTANFSNATLAGVNARGAQFGGIVQQFVLDPSYIGALNSGQMADLIPVFAAHGINLSPTAGVNKLRALWVVADGAARYPVVKETSGPTVTITVLAASSFVLDASLETALDQNAIASLQPAFQAGGVTLSAAAQVTLRTAAWKIVDSAGNRTFQVRLDIQSGGVAALRVFAGAASAQLSGAYMPNANLANANLYAVIASNCQFYGEKSSLQGAILEEAAFDGANLGTVSFQEAQMQGMVLTGAILTNCALNGANLTAGISGRAAALDNANLMGADFTDALLYGATLNRAAVGVNIPNVAQTSGVYLFSIPALADELNRASHLASLNPDGNADTFQNGVRALDNRQTAAVVQFFAAQGITISANADITTQATQQVWNIAGAAGAIIYTVWSALDANGAFEMYVKPWPAGAIFSLNPDGNPSDYGNMQAALSAGNTTALQPYFARQQQPLAAGARIVQAQQGTVWQVSDIGASYTVWAGLDSNFAMELWVRPIMPYIAGAFASAGVNLHPQATVTVQQAGSAWMLDNDSNNPVNFATGYLTFCLVTNGGVVDVYGVTLHIQQLSAGNRLQIATLPCNATMLAPKSCNGETVCPNGMTVASNQATGTAWTQWMRAPAPPHPPLCVPGAYTFCAPISNAAAAD
jgi:uncharacterized protein YjbI with pentapeptide repeats